MDRKLQQHRADSLRQHGFLVILAIILDRQLSKSKPCYTHGGGETMCGALAQDAPTVHCPPGSPHPAHSVKFMNK